MNRCRSCNEERPLSRLLRVTCLQHEAGDRNCLTPGGFYVCRPSYNGNRPDCVRYRREFSNRYPKGRIIGDGVLGADIHRIEVAV